MRRFALPALLRISFFTTLTIRSYGNGGCGVDPPAERGRSGLGCHYSFSPGPSRGRNEVPRGYSLTTNAMSDLGITTCGSVRDGDLPIREACSPWHSVFNGGLLASGTLMVVGAILLHGWWTGRVGRAG